MKGTLSTLSAAKPAVGDRPLTLGPLTLGHDPAPHSYGSAGINTGALEAAETPVIESAAENGDRTSVGKRTDASGANAADSGDINAMDRNMASTAWELGLAMRNDDGAEPDTSNSIDNALPPRPDATLTLSHFDSLAIQDILSGTVDFIQQHLDADRVVFHLVQATGVEPPADDAPILAEAVSANYSSIAGAAARESVSSACIQTLIRQCGHSPKAPFLSMAVSRAPSPLRALWESYHVQSALLVPLIHGEYLVGLFVIHQCSYDRIWSEREGAILRSALHELNIILLHSKNLHALEQKNAKLVSDLQKRTVQVQTAIQFESSLKRITDKVRDFLDEGKILQTAVQELSEVLELGGCNAALYNLQEGTSTICYEYTNFIAASRGRVAQMNKFPEIYNQLRNGMYFQFCSLIPNPKRGRVALLACPIFFAEQDSYDDAPQDVLGDLWLIHTENYVFSEFEIRLVQQVANQCAIAIRQARLYQAVQDQVKELERLNRLKDEFLSTVSHELRTPISNVKMAIHMLKAAPDEDRKQRYMEILEAESKREADLINDLLDLQKLESSNFPIQVETMRLQDWLPRVAEPFLSRMGTHQQVFNLQCDASLQPLKTDFNLLQRILSELLNNACKYTPGEGTIDMAAHPATTPGTDSSTSVVTLQIRNQAEIPAEELPHIFDKFYRVPNADPWKQGGTGLGLALVQKLVHQLDGTIQVDSQNGWTTFTVAIPNQSDAKPAESLTK